MGFRQRRAKVDEKADEAEPEAPKFHHSSGANTLERLLGQHTLAEETEMSPPKGYRARSIGKTEKRKAG
ncbi:MAG: hypothetical protein QOF28_2535 [Actinomycetota bacterium]|jgi:hypothetical protein|nr:hypothetical protein [Actinomycetota bacterium]